MEKKTRMAMLKKTIDAGSEDPFHHYAYALELRSAGQGEKALAKLEEVIKNFRDYVPTYLMAAQVAESLGKRDEAQGFARSGIEIATQSNDAHAASELESFLVSIT